MDSKFLVMPLSHLVTIDGHTQSLAAWARAAGLRYDTLRTRLRNGWDPKEAISRPTSGSAPRTNSDKYYTPEWLADEAMQILRRRFPDQPPKSALEPACGSGVVVRKLQQTFPDTCVAYFDVSPDDGFDCIKQDFFDYKAKDPPCLVITNPPYAKAQKFVEHALGQVRVGGTVMMLLRVDFFAGQARAGWLLANKPVECHVTVRRPTFRGKGCDTSEYAWFVWEKACHPEFTKTYLLDTRAGRYRP